MNYWIVIYRFAWGVLSVLFAIGIFFAFVPRYHRLRELHRQRVQIEQENRDLVAEIQELKEKQRLFHADPAFVELVAREAGMVKTNEVIYRLEAGQEQ